MLSRLIGAVIYGIVVFIVLVIVGMLLSEVGLAEIGNFIRGFAGLIALLVALWYLFVDSVADRPLLPRR